MSMFKELYPLDRYRRFEDLQSIGQADEQTLAMLDKFAELHGCIAYDLAIFPRDGGTLLLTWNYYIEDVREGGRRKNSHIIDAILTPTTFHMWPSNPDISKVYNLESPELVSVLNKFRTCSKQTI